MKLLGEGMLYLYDKDFNNLVKCYFYYFLGEEQNKNQLKISSMDILFLWQVNCKKKKRRLLINFRYREEEGDLFYFYRYFYFLNKILDDKGDYLGQLEYFNIDRVEIELRGNNF